MSMFCFQCQEALKNVGCTSQGVCGKTDDTANMMDLLIHVIKGASFFAHEMRKNNMKVDDEVNHFIMDGLFSTITNANFDKEAIRQKAYRGFEVRDRLRKQLEENGITFKDDELKDACTWTGKTDGELEMKAEDEKIGPLETENEDVRSLRELITYGLKGMAAYAEHAYNLDHKKEEIYAFMEKALADTLNDSLSVFVRK